MKNATVWRASTQWSKHSTSRSIRGGLLPSSVPYEQNRHEWENLQSKITRWFSMQPLHAPAVRDAVNHFAIKIGATLSKSVRNSSLLVSSTIHLLNLSRVLTKVSLIVLKQFYFAPSHPRFPCNTDGRPSADTSMNDTLQPRFLRGRSRCCGINPHHTSTGLSAPRTSI